MRNKVLLFSILFSLFLFSSISFAIEFYTPDEIQGLNYVSVFEYCQNTTSTAWWDIFGWFGSGNVSEYFSCWDFSFNSTAPTTWIATTEGLDFGSPIDEVSLTIHPLNHSGYGKFYYFDNSSSNYWLNSSVFLPANKEAIVYISYMVNNTTYIDSSLTSLYVYDRTKSIVFQNNTLPTTAGVYHNITLTIPADNFIARDIWVRMGFTFIDLEAPVQILIDNFEIFTLDDEVPFIANNFTTSYGLDKCNSTEYQSNFYMDYGRQIFVVNETTGFRGVGCVVYLHDNVTYTRRAIEIFDAGTGGTPPFSSGHAFVSSRDKAFVRNNDVEWAGHDTEAPMLFTQIQTHELKLYIDNSTSIFTEPQLLFSDSGLVNLTTIYDYCNTTYDYNQLCSYPLSTAGNEYYIDFFAYGNTENNDVFSVSYCSPSYVCSFGSLYFTNADCSSTEILDCGVWGCNTNGDGCNYPTNPENASETVSNYGSYCFENNDYSFYTLNATGIFISSCEFPNKCRQLTDTTIGCSTDEEFERTDSQGSLPKATSYGLAKTLGTTTVIANLLVSIIVTLVGAFALTSRVKDNHSNVFFAVVIIGMVSFYYLEMIPFEMFAFIILAVAGLWFLVYQKITSTGG